MDGIVEARLHEPRFPEHMPQLDESAPLSDPMLAAKVALATLPKASLSKIYSTRS
jgi:hypothetical protein